MKSKIKNLNQKYVESGTKAPPCFVNEKSLHFFDKSLIFLYSRLKSYSRKVAIIKRVGKGVAYWLGDATSSRLYSCFSFLRIFSSLACLSLIKQFTIIVQLRVLRSNR